MDAEKFTEALNLPVVHIDDDYDPDPPPDELPWLLYQTVRNVIYRVCQIHGRAGAMGICPVELEDIDAIDDTWPVGENPCDYYVVDDQYSDYRYIRVEVESQPFLNPDWLQDIVQALRDYPEWGVVLVSIAGGNVVLHTDRIIVSGPLYEKCRNVASVLAAARTHLGEDVNQQWETIKDATLLQLKTGRTVQVELPDGRVLKHGDGLRTVRNLLWDGIDLKFKIDHTEKTAIVRIMLVSQP